jgi:hypothetical protein
MFETVFNTMGAFNQALLLLAGGFLLLIGGLLLGDALNWRLRAARVEGRVLGVRRKGGVFYTVFEYTLPDGRRIEATADNGSSLISGRETGRPLKLMVFPDKPTRARDTGSFMAGIVGTLLAAPGILLVWVALRQSGFGWLTVLFVLGILVLQFRKIKLRTPEERRQWMEDRTTRRAEKEQERIAKLGPVMPIEQFLNSPEEIGKTQKNKEQMAKMAPFLILGGVALLALGVWLGQKQLTLEQRGVRTPAVVVDIVSSSDSDGTTYASVFSFTDKNGREFRVKDKVSSNPPADSEGEKVTALYDPQDPGENAMIDRGFWNWLPAGLLALFGAGLAFLGIRSRRTDQTAWPA